LFAEASPRLCVCVVLPAGRGRRATVASCSPDASSASHQAVRLGFAAHFLHSLSFSLFLHLPGFVRELGGNELRRGVLSGITALTAVLARPLIVGSIDRARRGTIVVGSAAQRVQAA
jgi:hypothetical protein